MDSFTMVSGDNRTLNITVLDPAGAPVDLSAATLTWRAGLAPQADPVLEKTGMVGDVAGKFDVVLVPFDTATLSGVFYHWVAVDIAAIMTTYALGLFVVNPPTSLASPEMFKTRFPQFASVSDVLIRMILDEVSPGIGATWMERDRIPAQLYLTAHILSMEGEPARSAGGGGGGTTGGAVQSLKVGDVAVTFGSFTATGSSGVGSEWLSWFNQTSYGQRYLYYMRRNFPAIEVV